MNRFLKLINLLIAAGALAALVCTYWFVWRVLPETSGRLSLPVRAGATVARDALGVPHIKAGSLEDAVFLQGYVMAQDRLWQMDMARRRAVGELAEVVGKVALEEDRTHRVLRIRRVAEAMARELTAEDRAILAAYARGVNEFMRTHRGALPVEFSVLRYQPRPWSIADTLAIGLEMNRTLSQTHLNEMRKFALRGAGDAAKVDYLYPVRTGGEVFPGSNAWVVSGARSATGKPMLANDPHLEFGFPSTWYQVHLQAPDLNVTGVTLPGVPMVIIGHNERIAWGVTNLHFDVMDIYAEKIDARQARTETELIAINGERPVSLMQYVAAHGPAFEALGQYQLALRWGAAEPGFKFIFPALNKAKNWEEFRAALAEFRGPAQNFVYADVDGHIGYQAAGRMPVRSKECNASLPIASGCEWQGFIPFEKLPSAYDPAGGVIVTANQNPFPADYEYPVAGQFSPPFRANQIRTRLAAKAKLTVNDMLAIQKDVYSPFSHWLAQELVRVVKPLARGADAQEALTVLAAWNGQMEPNLAAPLIVTFVEQNLRREIANRAAPNRGDLWDLDMSSAVIQKLFMERPAGWFEDYDQVLLRCLIEAVRTGEQKHGKLVDRWEYGQEAPFVLAHPVLSRVPLVGQFFAVGPVPMAGSRTTVKQTTPRLGPSMRFVADLADWDASRNNVTLGVSGQPLSGHFDDQWKAYYVGESFAMQYKRVDARQRLEITPQL